MLFLVRISRLKAQKIVLYPRELWIFLFTTLSTFLGWMITWTNPINIQGTVCVLSDLDDVDHMGELISAPSSYSYFPILMKLFPYNFKLFQNKCAAFRAVLWPRFGYFMTLINLSNFPLFKVNAVREWTLAWFSWFVTCLAGVTSGSGVRSRTTPIGVYCRQSGNE
jgi:hypothetical protein